MTRSDLNGPDLRLGLSPVPKGTAQYDPRPMPREPNDINGQGSHDQDIN
jgi:hypothetical protein